MTTELFLSRLDECIHKYDLLCHPFYKAWSAGELTREDLCEYAQDYYHHVEAFPTYLAELAMRLDEGDLRRVVLANMTEEKGGDGVTASEQTSHSELWLDFVEGLGGKRTPKQQPVEEI
ncbi:MAG TPA: iron-containing redox enzyme family protein, partial [Terriglobales bacterium]|nr:iron-containing redox enzyme family protein [Terriglobales bacterium]